MPGIAAVVLLCGTFIYMRSVLMQPSHLTKVVKETKNPMKVKSLIPEIYIPNPNDLGTTFVPLPAAGDITLDYKVLAMQYKLKYAGDESYGEHNFLDPRTYKEGGCKITPIDTY
jgi:hypothetical protein